MKRNPFELRQRAYDKVRVDGIFEINMQRISIAKVDQFESERRKLMVCEISSTNKFHDIFTLF